MRKLCCLVVFALTVGACGSDESTTDEATVTTLDGSTLDGSTLDGSTLDGSTLATVETTTVTTVSITTPTVTTVSNTTPTATTEPTASDTAPVDTAGAASEPCEPPAGTDSVAVDFPMGMSSLIGREIRTGAKPCAERVVLELQGDGEMPGYRVEYVVDPVTLSPSDLEVDIAGAATLVLSVAVWMTTMEGQGYEGPDQITPTNVELIDELRLIENFEGMHQWAIGLDRQRPFEVTTLTDPPRIVIDIAR